jgi:DNA topoisomerase-6 subunit B
MTFQSTLSDDESVAEQLEESQRQISISEFFEKNKQMLGFDSDSRGIVTAVKEAVDNSLDAAEEAGHLPEISVEVQESGEYYKLIVEDNGPGITKEQLPKVFGKLLYGSRFHKREQSRGQQGIGISAAVMYSQLTSGKSAKIWSKPKDHEAQYFELRIDTEKNEPEIQASDEIEWDEKSHGIKIELEMSGDMRARQQLHDYITHTGIVNPHAKLTFNEPKLSEPMVFERATDQLPDETEEIKPHPHGVQLGTLKSMLEDTDSYSVSGFLQEDFTRVGKKTAESILDGFRDHEYGRQMGWSAPENSEDVIEAVTDVVNNKGKEDTRRYALLIADAIEEQSPVAYADIEQLVNDAADEAVEDFGRAFGSTVRDKSTDAVWGVVKQSSGYDYENNKWAEETDSSGLYEVLDEATGKRKSDRGVKMFSLQLAELVISNSEKHQLPKNRLQKEIDSIADTVKSEVGDSFGETSKEKIFDAVWDRMTTVNVEVPNTDEIAKSRDSVANMLAGMQDSKVMAPPSSCLSPITEDLVTTGLKKVFDAEFYSSATRDADSQSGEPFIAEAGIAYGGDIMTEGKSELLRFANRVPLVYQRGACATTDVVKRIDWRNYELNQTGGRGIPTDQVVILIHVASTNVPFTSESKDAIANVEAMEDEIERALRDAARDLKSHLKKKENLKKRRERQSIVARVLPKIAEKAAGVVNEKPADIDGSLAKIMNSVMVEPREEKVHIKNYNGDATFEVHIGFEDEKPTYPSQNTERVETENGWRIQWGGRLEEGDDLDITWNADEEPDVSLENIPREKVTYKQGDSQ